MKTPKAFQYATTFEKEDLIPNVILKKLKKNKGIVYGARSIQAQNKILARSTTDYDVLVKQPKVEAFQLQKELDNLYGFDHFYAKEGMHKGTWKVKSKGFDMIQDTKDDVGWADFTKQTKPVPKFVLINGVRYRVLKEEIQAKKKALADKEFKFRHEKDRNDLNRLKAGIKIKQLMG